MAVGEDDALQVLGGVTQAADVVENLGPVAGKTAVDQGQATVFHQ